MVGSAYEAWVMALRSWRDDPRHDLSTLPALSVDSLPPAAYERLFGHIRAAQQRVMDRWSEVFAREWGNATDDHARVRALVNTRVLLARRLQLAGHSGLPEVVRAEFVAGVTRDVRQLQKELEESVSKQSGHRVDHSYAERTLGLLRANRLTAILEPGFPLDALIEGRIAAPEPMPEPAQPQLQPDSGPQPVPPRRKFRAIIIDN